MRTAELLLLCIVAAAASPAKADWVVLKDESVFSEFNADNTITVVQAQDEFSLVIQCVPPMLRATLSYSFPGDLWVPADGAQENSYSLLLKIDGNVPMKLGGIVGYFGGGRAMAATPLPPNVVDQLNGAKAVSVAVQYKSQPVSAEHKFENLGHPKALLDAMDECRKIK
jgi:hypothetical protein